MRSDLGRLPLISIQALLGAEVQSLVTLHQAVRNLGGNEHATHRVPDRSPLGSFCAPLCGAARLAAWTPPSPTGQAANRFGDCPHDSQHEKQIKDGFK
jgi:hypothetical protein